MPELNFGHLLEEESGEALLCTMIKLFHWIKYPESLPGTQSNDDKLTSSLLHGLVGIASGPESSLADRRFTVEEARLLQIYNQSYLENEREARFSRGMLAGMVLSYVWKLDLNKADGSISKSIHVVGDLKKVSTSQVRKIWGQYKNVSHFFAGCQVLRLMGFPEWSTTQESPTLTSIIKDQELINKWIFLVLFWSVQFYSYATKRIEPRTRLPLLDSKEIWMVPDKMLELSCKFYKCETPTMETVKWNLSDEEKRALSSYKSNLS